MKRILLSLLALFFLILLLLSPGTALEGARKGLLLWAYTVLPTLLPFMIGTGVIAAMGAVGLVVKPFSPLLSGVFHFSQPAGFVFLTGLLCGYPMGAKMDRDLLERGQISWEEACYLLSICNHPSPMFLTGYTVMEGQKLLPPSIKISSFSLPCSPLSSSFFPFLIWQGIIMIKNPKKNRKIRPSVWSGVSHTAPNFLSFSLDEHLMSCLENYGKKSGFYIMLFSILSLYFLTAPSRPCYFKTCSYGAFRDHYRDPNHLRTYIRSHWSALSHCKCCFWRYQRYFPDPQCSYNAQRQKKNAGLSIRHYIFWKALHSLLSCVFFWILLKI